MEEKILVKSKPCMPIIPIVILVIGIIVSIFLYSSSTSYWGNMYDQMYATYTNHNYAGGCNSQNSAYTCGACRTVKAMSRNEYIMDSILTYELSVPQIPSFLIPLLVALIISCIAYVLLISYQLTITTTRISGKILWGVIKFSSPVSMVSFVQVNYLIKSITIITPSNKIRFGLIRNVKEIYETLCALSIQVPNQPADE